MINKKWTKKEIKILTDNYNKIFIKDIAILLNRTLYSVQDKIHRMALENKKEIPIEIKVGNKFGRLLIIEKINKKTINYHYYYKCLCDCGKEKIVLDQNLRSKKARSCGCLQLERVSKDPGEITINRLERQYKAGAIDRDLLYNLTKEEFKQITSKSCHYCNSSPKKVSFYSESKIGISISEKTYERSVILFNGIDRVDSDIGYILNNCVPCCTQCNIMKHDYTKNEFLEQIEKIYNWNKNG